MTTARDLKEKEHGEQLKEKEEEEEREHEGTGGRKRSAQSAGQEERRGSRGGRLTCLP